MAGTEGRVDCAGPPSRRAEARRAGPAGREALAEVGLEALGG